MAAAWFPCRRHTEMVKHVITLRHYPTNVVDWFLLQILPRAFDRHTSHSMIQHRHRGSRVALLLRRAYDVTSRRMTTTQPATEARPIKTPLILALENLNQSHNR